MIEDINLIRKLAWSYTRTHPEMEFDELFSEACLACLEATPRYDPSKARKSTYYYHVARSHLNNLVKRESRRRFREASVDIAEYEPILANDEHGPEEMLAAEERWEEMLAMLSPEARMICDIVVRNDVYLPTDRPKHCRGIIYRQLREKGWSWSNIWNTFQELKQVVATCS